MITAQLLAATLMLPTPDYRLLLGPSFSDPYYRNRRSQKRKRRDLRRRFFHGNYPAR
jgi:hypothetical protein